MAAGDLRNSGLGGLVGGTGIDFNTGGLQLIATKHSYQVTSGAKTSPVQLCPAPALDVRPDFNVHSLPTTPSFVLCLQSPRSMPGCLATAASGWPWLTCNERPAVRSSLQQSTAVIIDKTQHAGLARSKLFPA